MMDQGDSGFSPLTPPDGVEERDEVPGSSLQWVCDSDHMSADQRLFSTPLDFMDFDKTSEPDNHLMSLISASYTLENVLEPQHQQGQIEAANSQSLPQLQTTRRFMCGWPGCGTTFIRRADLRRHRTSVHIPGNPMGCPFPGCEKTFSRMDKLRNHERQKHSLQNATVKGSLQRNLQNTSTQGFQHPANKAIMLSSVLEGNGSECGFGDIGNPEIVLPKLEVLAPESHCLVSNDVVLRPPAAEDSQVQYEESPRALSLSGDGISTRSKSPDKIALDEICYPDSLGYQAQENHNETHLACPFNKHNPQMYNIHTHRTCAVSGWNSVSRLKEHLYRRHRVPLHCVRCYTIFKSNSELHDHLVQPVTCEVNQNRPINGMTSDTEKLIRKRNNFPADQPEVDRWKHIYHLLFPDEIVPSPYFEPNQLGNSQHLKSIVLGGYNAYCRLELPRIFESRLTALLEAEQIPLDAELMSSKMSSMLQECQEYVFKRYQAMNTIQEEGRFAGAKGEDFMMSLNV